MTFVLYCGPVDTGSVEGNSVMIKSSPYEDMYLLSWVEDREGVFTKRLKYVLNTQVSEEPEDEY